MKTENNFLNKEFLIKFLIGMAISFAATFLLSGLFAVLMTLFDMNTEMSSPLSTVAIAVGCFLGSYFVLSKFKQKGLLIGALFGIAFFVLKTLVSLAVSGGSVTLVSVFHLLSAVLSSSIAGILAVNNANKLKNYSKSFS